MAVAGRDIFGKLCHALDEIGPAGRDRLAEDLRIGEDEVGRREGFRHLAHVKQRLGAGVLVQPFGFHNHPVGKTDGGLIGFEEKIENGLACQSASAKRLFFRSAGPVCAAFSERESASSENCATDFVHRS